MALHSVLKKATEQILRKGIFLMSYHMCYLSILRNIKKPFFLKDFSLDHSIILQKIPLPTFEYQISYKMILSKDEKSIILTL